MNFTLRLAILVVGGAIIAAIISPFAASALAAAGFHFPFPRIFDRTVMVVLAGLLIWQARKLRLMHLLRSGFDRPVANLGRVTRGFLIAIIAVAILIYLAAALGARATDTTTRIWALLGKYVLSAFVIAIIEEAFFRAILLGGMEGDFGRIRALLLSSAIYSFAHLVRSPAKFYVSGLHPMAGLITLGASLAHLSQVNLLAPTFVGLFLLGVLLGEAFLRTGTVYFPIGLHAGVVVGAKLWPRMTGAGTALPGWLRGWGSQVLVSGLAAWGLIVLLIAMTPLLIRRPRV